MSYRFVDVRTASGPPIALFRQYLVASGDKKSGARMKAFASSRPDAQVNFS